MMISQTTAVPREQCDGTLMREVKIPENIAMELDAPVSVARLNASSPTA
jgi:hypothetical protein